MNLEENKALIRYFYDELWNKGNLDLIDTYFAPNYTDHDTQTDPLGVGPGADGADPRTAAKDAVAALRAAFPDVRFTIGYQVAEGDKVVTYYTATATQTGALGPIPPTHKRATIDGFYVDRLSGGQIVESWSLFDSLGLLQQLGVIPAPGRRAG
jgi:predicted SnoaL-like aldol condensation-catalyzing enzyme